MVPEEFIYVPLILPQPAEKILLLPIYTWGKGSEKWGTTPRAYNL